MNKRISEFKLNVKTVHQEQLKKIVSDMEESELINTINLDRKWGVRIEPIQHNGRLFNIFKTIFDLCFRYRKTNFRPEYELDEAALRVLAYTILMLRNNPKLKLISQEWDSLDKEWEAVDMSEFIDPYDYNYSPNPILKLALVDTSDNSIEYLFN